MDDDSHGQETAAVDRRMYKGKRIGVVIPAYNEEQLITETLETLPEFVDMVVVIDDCSSDETSAKVADVQARDSRVQLLKNEVNQGVGASVARGYQEVLQREVDLVCVMAGDAQCDPNYLHALLDKVMDEGYDMAKGNRFLLPTETVAAMPLYRLWGNVILTILTKAASGYWTIFDTQNGYLALRAETLRRLDLSRISRRYDLENSMLINLNVIGARVSDVAIPARYGEEVSGIRLWRVAPRMLLTLFFGFFQRIYRKYVLYNFHPIALFLYSGLLLMAWGLAFGAWATAQSIGEAAASTGTVMLSVLPFLMGFQLVLAALVLDITNEPR